MCVAYGTYACWNSLGHVWICRCTQPKWPNSTSSCPMLMCTSLSACMLKFMKKCILQSVLAHECIMIAEFNCSLPRIGWVVRLEINMCAMESSLEVLSPVAVCCLVDKFAAPVSHYALPAAPPHPPPQAPSLPPPFSALYPCFTAPHPPASLPHGIMPGTVSLGRQVC